MDGGDIECESVLYLKTWKDIYNLFWISQYLEAVVIPRDCGDGLTMSELRIKASSEFFGPSCKAGIWDEDQTRDKMLSKF